MYTPMPRPATNTSKQILWGKIMTLVSSFNLEYKRKKYILIFYFLMTKNKNKNQTRLTFLFV